MGGMNPALAYRVAGPPSDASLCVRADPPAFLDRYISVYHSLPRAWLVTPDYPGDYHPQPRNVERTIESVRRCIENYPSGVKWLPVLQSKLLDVESFRRGIRAVKALGLDLYRERLAIGTVCKCMDFSFTRKCISIARRQFPDAWIHAFGLTLGAVRRLKEAMWLNSWDSMAWTFPRCRGGHSCRTADERRRYWREYLCMLPDVDGQSTLIDYT